MGNFKIKANSSLASSYLFKNWIMDMFRHAKYGKSHIPRMIPNKAKSRYLIELIFADSYCFSMIWFYFNELLTDGRMDQWRTHGLTNRWTYWRTHEWTHRRTDGRINGRRDKWMNGRMEDWTNGRTEWQTVITGRILQMWENDSHHFEAVTKSAQERSTS